MRGIFRYIKQRFCSHKNYQKIPYCEVTLIRCKDCGLEGILP